MRADLPAVLMILGMALATFATRVSGVWLARRGEPPAFVAKCFRHIPGAVITALVVPVLAAGGVPVILAGIATVLIAARTENVLLASAVGAAGLWLLRSFM